MPHVKFMEKLDKANKLLRQFPHGIRATVFAEKFGLHRTRAYDYLNSLEVRDLAYNEHGLWFPKQREKPTQIDELKPTSRYEKRLDAIRQENFLDPFIAYVDLLFFIGTLPYHIRNLVEPEIQQATLAIIVISKKLSWQLGQVQERKKQFVSVLVLYFLNRISALLHGQIEMTASQRQDIEFDSSFIKWLGETKEDAIESLMKALKKALPNLR